MNGFPTICLEFGYLATERSALKIIYQLGAAWLKKKYMYTSGGVYMLQYKLLFLRYKGRGGIFAVLQRPPKIAEPIFDTAVYVARANNKGGLANTNSKQ